MVVSPSHHLRIGIDARFYRASTGGIGRYTRHLIAGIAALDHETEYVVFLTPEDFAEWQAPGPNFRPVVVDAPIFSIAEQTSFLRVLQKERLDLVHFLNFNHPLLYRGPFITTLHDLTMYSRPAGRSQKSMLRRQVFRQVFRRSLTGAKQVIAISEYSAHDAEKVFGIAPTKIEVIHHGAPDPLEMPFGSKAAVQQYLGSKQPYLLFVSQWRPHKGILTLIQAFDRFKDQTGLPHQLVLVGKQSALEETVKEALAQAKYAQDILTPGFVPDEILPALYHHATLHVLPSEYEGFGMTILEAYVYGTPVVAADNSSIPEVVGDAGLLFPTGDVAALANRLAEIAQSPTLAHELSEKAAVQVRNFSWKRAAKKTHALYLSVLEKRR
jgi:glycosyltransferase involved in cell wall biosynthesis